MGTEPLLTPLPVHRLYTTVLGVDMHSLRDLPGYSRHRTSGEEVEKGHI